MQRIFLPESVCCDIDMNRQEPFNTAENSGAYRLHIVLKRSAVIHPGRLGQRRLEAGHYCYIGSARRGLRQRVTRHQRVAIAKLAGGRWHIDALLSHRYAHIEQVELLPGGDECALSYALSLEEGVMVPIVGFGATDCRHGCSAHLYRMP